MQICQFLGRSIIVMLMLSSLASANQPTPESTQTQQISQQAGEFLKITEDRLKYRNEAHYFFLAMCAQQGDNAVAAGRRIVENFNAFEKVESSGCAGMRFRRLLPKGFPCDLVDEECYREFLGKSDNRLQDVERYKDTLLMYNKFLSYQTYATLSRPKLNAPRGQYVILRVGSLLRTMDILRYAKQRDAQASAAALVSDVRRLRTLLAQADTLRLKTHIAALINRNLQALIFIKEQYGLRQIQRINPVTETEADFRLIVSREFSENYHTVYNQDAAAIMRLLAGAEEGDSQSAAAAKRLARGYEDQYDRVPTINDIAQIYAQLLSVSPLSDQWNLQVSQKIDDFRETYTRKYVRQNKMARNAIGFGIIRSTIESFYSPYLKLNQVLLDINANIQKLN